MGSLSTSIVTAASRLLAALAFASCVATYAAAADLPFARAATSTSLVWTCEYVVTPNELWVVRCYQLDVLASYDAVTDAREPVVWDVPLWGPPMSDERAADLVRAVLCRAARSCDVLITRPLAVAGRRTG